MNKAKALLDSLMGPSRDLSSAEKKDCEDFKADNVCKMHLVGFCPDQLLAKRGESTKACSKIHSQPLRDELESHPDREKYKEQYERGLLHYLKDLVAEVDATVAIEKKTCRRRETVVKVSESKRPVLQQLEQEHKTKVAMAERLGNEGDIEGAAKAMEEADACQKEADSIKEQHTWEWPGEDMCTVCGTRYLCGSSKDIKGDFYRRTSIDGHDRPPESDVWESDHMKDKLHLAYKKFRDKIQELKETKAKREEERSKNTGRDNHGDRRRGDDDDDDDDDDKGRPRGDDDKGRSRGDKNRDDRKDRDDRRGGDRDRDRGSDRRGDRGGGRDRRGRSRSHSGRRRDLVNGKSSYVWK